MCQLRKTKKINKGMLLGLEQKQMEVGITLLVMDNI